MSSMRSSCLNWRLAFSESESTASVKQYANTEAAPPLLLHMWQGSRLTAFELVHDNIPATLTVDSAAAALMKDGKVSAVVVGDLEQTVWLRMVTLLTREVPTVLPSVQSTKTFHILWLHNSLLSTLSLSSGGETVIEERSLKEFLNTHGGLGEQVAASGISVWNPAFDVTPASLISGIITEKFFRR